jgi:hypothetical protein
MKSENYSQVMILESRILMNNYTDEQLSRGSIQMIIDWDDPCKPREYRYFKNTVLTLGRVAMASSLANDIGNQFNFFISRMLFGDGGTVGGVPQFVDAGRNGLFGITRANLPVIAQVDPLMPTQAIFTSVIGFDQANGFVLSEMALQMNTGDFFSMATFPDLSKTPQIQITFNWQLSFV